MQIKVAKAQAIEALKKLAAKLMLEAANELKEYQKENEAARQRILKAAKEAVRSLEQGKKTNTSYLHWTPTSMREAKDTSYGRQAANILNQVKALEMSVGDTVTVGTRNADSVIRQALGLGD